MKAFFPNRTPRFIQKTELKDNALCQESIPAAGLDRFLPFLEWEPGGY
jgi:hypothetical protein